MVIPLWIRTPGQNQNLIQCPREGFRSGRDESYLHLVAVLLEKKGKIQGRKSETLYILLQICIQVGRK